MVNNIAPPPPPNAVITIQPLTTPVGSQQNASPVLQGVANGTLIEGFVVNRDAQQNPVLRTSIGDILVKSEIFLKTGSEVVIRVDAMSDTRAKIISIDGMTPQDYTSKAVTILPTRDEIMNPSLMPSNTRTMPVTPQGNASTAPMILNAVLLSANVMVTEGLPPTVAQYLSQAVAALQKDVSVALKIIATELPPTAQTPQQPAAVIPAAIAVAPDKPTPTTQVPQQPTQVTSQPIPQVAQQVTPQPTTQNIPPVSTAPVPATQAVPQALVQVPTQAAAHPTAATANPAPQNPATLPQQATAAITTPTAQRPVPQMTAHVIGHEFDGASIIQTPVGTLKLMTAQPLPTGSKLTVEIAPEAKPVTPTQVAPLLPTDLEEFTVLARDWTSLRDALTSLAAYNPAAADQIIQNAIPKPHAKLTSEMLFLFAAIKNGTPEQWFSKRATEILELRSPEILKRLSRDFAQLQQVFSDALPQWMSVIVPFYSDAQLQQIRMFFKHDEESGSKGGEAGQRFVVELELSHLGDMQFDGFVKKTERRQHFDLIVRSARTLPTEVEQNIRTIFEQSLSATGFRGYVNFQQGIQHFVRPLESVKEALNAGTNAIIA